MLWCWLICKTVNPTCSDGDTELLFQPINRLMYVIDITLVYIVQGAAIYSRYYVDSHFKKAARDIKWYKKYSNCDLLATVRPPFRGYLKGANDCKIAFVTLVNNAPKPSISCGKILVDTQPRFSHT